MADSETATDTPVDLQDLSPGATLRQAREVKQTSIQEIADQLHLDRWMLEALERNDFAALGAPVFAKGHLRQYAKVLGVDPDDLMVAYYQVCGSREQPPLLAESMMRAEGNAEQSFTWLWPTLLTLAVIIGVGVAIFLWMQPTEEPSSISSEVTQFDKPMDNTETVEVADTTAQPLPLPAVMEPAVPDDSSENLLIPAKALPTPQESDAVESAAGSIVSHNLMVTMRLSGESWVEVYDAKRQKLLYGLADSATVKYLSGPPPISVYLGSHKDVSIEVGGESYAIPQQAVKGKTARFQIDAPD